MSEDSTSISNPMALSITGDGIRWENLILFPAYPAGFTYFRAMRYADRFIDPETLGKIRSDPGSLVGRSAVIYIRFLSDPDSDSVLIPLRQAEIIGIDYMTDNLSVFVRLGAMYDFRKFTELRDAALKSNPEFASGSRRYLVFNPETSPHPADFAALENEHDAWTRYVDLLAGSTQLLVAQEARNAIFLRMRQMDTRRGPFAIKLLYRSKFSGSHFGTYMVEGEKYELIYCHRIPALIGSEDGPRPFALRYAQSDQSIRMSRERDLISQNYETHVLELAGQKSSSLNLEELVISADPAQPATLNSKELYTADLRISYRVGPGWSYRFRRTGALVILLAVSFFLSSLVSLYATHGPPNAQGQTSSVSVEHVVLSFGLASIAAAIVFIIQRRGSG
jgi:hypothetical protein